MCDRTDLFYHNRLFYINPHLVIWGEKKKHILRKKVKKRRLKWETSVHLGGDDRVIRVPCPHNWLLHYFPCVRVCYYAAGPAWNMRCGNVWRSMQVACQQNICVCRSPGLNRRCAGRCRWIKTESNEDKVSWILLGFTCLYGDFCSCVP